MNSFIKRLVSSATSLVMITSCFAGTITTSAAQQTWSMSDGKITLTLNDEGTKLTVNGTGAMEDYSMATKQPYKDNVSNVTEIDIQSGITAIGKFNFGNNFKAVETVTIADTVTKIGESAFFNCTSATIDIKGKLIADNVISKAFGGTTSSYVKKIIVHDQGTYDAVYSKTGNGKVDIELQADASALKQDLQNLIKTTREKYKQEDYTEVSYNELSKALTEAESIVAQVSPSNEEIQKATKAINDAISKLVPIIDGLKSELQSAIDEARKIVTTTYTTSSVAALNKAIEDAQTAVAKPEVTKDELTKAKTALETASKVDETGVAETGLKVKASVEGLQRRDAAYNDAGPIINRKDYYTEESFAKFKEAYDKLIELRAKGSIDTTDGQIDALITELNAAKEQLEEVGEITFDLEEYNAAKKAVEDILNAENSPYTKKSLESLKSIYDSQKSIIEDETGKIKNGIIQGRIDSVVKVLNRSIDPIDSSCPLVEKGDLTNLQSLVESTKELAEANYTAETWTALSDEKEKAEALISDPDNAAKADVEASEEALTKAIDALAYKPADYKAVDVALAKVPSDLSKYTDETVKALQNAIDAVDRNKKITEQAEVDAFAKAIEKAIAGLKLKPSSSSQKPGTVSGTSGKSSVKSVAQLKAEKAMNQAKITKLTVKSKAKKTIVVKWNKVKNAKGYQVQVSTKRNFKKLIVNKKSVKKNKITVKNKKLKKGKKYFVRVRAYATYKNSKGVTKKAYSSWNKKLRTVKIK